MVLAYEDTITLPRALRFPVELIPPEGFDPARLETWPRVDGRLEYVDGRLLYMPPCGDAQQDTTTDVVIALGHWVREHRADFILGTNEAGMRLRGQTRAADAAVWRRSDVRERTGGLRHQPPVLAVEVAGRDDTEDHLLDKARWYVASGVAVVWLVFPDSREVVVVTEAGESRVISGEAIPPHPGLPELHVEVAALFVQLDEP